MDTLKSVLQSLGQGARWQDEARRTLEVRTMLRSILPTELAEATSVSLPEPGILQVSCQNGMVATRVRHIVPTLQDKMKTIGLEVKNIQVDVRPELVRISPSFKAKRSPSSAPEEASQALESLAKKQKNPAFGDALARLAKRLRETR